MKSISILMRLLRTTLNLQVLRFLLVGSVNTILGYIIYLGLSFIFVYSTAYSISFFLGVLTSYYLNTKFVFKELLSWKKLLQFPLVYITQYLIGLMLMILLIEKMSVSLFLAPLCVVVITLPVTYCVSRWVIKTNANKSQKCSG